MNWTLVTAASSSAAGRRPSGEIAAACARPPIVIPASATTRAAVSDTITFFIGFPLGLDAHQPSNPHIRRKFQMASWLRPKGWSAARSFKQASAQRLARGAKFQTDHFKVSNETIHIFDRPHQCKEDLKKPNFVSGHTPQQKIRQ
jgi:hypothetical protein